MWVVQWLVQGVAVTAVATLAAALMPSAAPRLRHAFWWLTLVAVLALPVLTALGAPHGMTAGGDAPPTIVAIAVTAPPPWLWMVGLALWGVTSLFGLAALVADLRVVRALKRKARPMPWPTLCRASALRTSARPVRGARLLVSDDLDGACAIGFFTPRVIISSQLTASLDTVALDAIVRHELAHLERFDDWLRLLQRVALTVAGLHPAVRWISRQIDVEREAACDQRVVADLGDPSAYARTLAAVAELVTESRRSAPVVAPGVAIGGAGLHARVVRLLRAETDPAPWRLRASAAASAVMLTLSVVGAAALPSPVAVMPLDQPLRVLASLPPARVFRTPLPELRARVVSASLLTNKTVKPLATEGTAGITDQAASPAAAELAVHRVEDPPATPEVLTVPSRRDVSLDLSSAAASPPGVADAPVLRVARAGVAAGNGAARAGSAIGRFFSKGGRAAADRF